MPDLRQRLDEALRAGKHERALELYDRLARENPKEPRWPHRRGELLLRMDEKARALDSFERAVDLYAAEGFVAKAAALAKVMIGVAPNQEKVLERVDPVAARELIRRRRMEAARRPSPPNTTPARGTPRAFRPGESPGTEKSVPPGPPPLPRTGSGPKPPPLPHTRPKPPPLPHTGPKPPPLPGTSSRA